MLKAILAFAVLAAVITGGFFVGVALDAISAPEARLVYRAAFSLSVYWGCAGVLAFIAYHYLRRPK